MRLGIVEIGVGELWVEGWDGGLDGREGGLEGGRVGVVVRGGRELGFDW